MPARTTTVRHNTLLTASSTRRHARSRSSSVERASSVGAKGPRKDTRPLTDKTYQATLLNMIDNFFRVNQRSAILNSNGSLKPITLKMFVEVSDYMLKYLDIKHELTVKNYVEELPKFAKKLHYPGVMTKSWLKTANAMHSWPHVLGWIGWLVEACQVKKIAFDSYKLETLPFTGTEQEALSSKGMFMTLLECYKAWNNEKHEEEAELLERYLQDVSVQRGITKEDIIQARKELEEETAKLRMLEEDERERDERLEHLKRTLASLRAKEAKQSNDIKMKEKYIKEISAKTDQLNAECKVLNDQIRMGNVQHEKLVSIVRDQPMSKAERENILKKCLEIQKYIRVFDKHLEDYEKDLYSLDIKLACSSNNLNKAIWAYNKEVFMHIDNDVGMDFDKLKLPERGLLDPQIMDVLEEKAALMRTFKELLAKRCIETQSLIHSDTLKLEKLQAEIKSLPDEVKLKREESLVSQMKADAKRKKADLVKQIEALRNEIKEIQDATYQTRIPDVRAIDLEIEEATDKLEAVTRRKTFLEESAEQFFAEFYQMLGSQRAEMQNLLTKRSDPKT